MKQGWFTPPLSQRVVVSTNSDTFWGYLASPIDGFLRVAGILTGGTPFLSVAPMGVTGSLKVTPPSSLAAASKQVK